MSKRKQKAPSKPARTPGRPRELVMPDPIPDTPENVARSIMQGPPMAEWDYLKPGSGARREGPTDE